MIKAIVRIIMGLSPAATRRLTMPNMARNANLSLYHLAREISCPVYKEGEVWVLEEYDWDWRNVNYSLVIFHNVGYR
jgi:hypothetical protein